MLIHRFIESIATNLARLHCSRTVRWRSGWMFARNTTSAAAASSDNFGANCSNTFRSVTSVSREFRLSRYSPFQKNVLPPRTCSTSSVMVPRVRSVAHDGSSKSSPTGPTTRTSSKNDAASAKCVAAPPSIRSRDPDGVLTASYAIEPTTVTVMRGARVVRWGSRTRIASRRCEPSSSTRSARRRSCSSSTSASRSPATVRCSSRSAAPG